MYEYLFQNLMPRLESAEAQIRKLQCDKKSPEISVEIESTDVDALIMRLQKIYQNFSGSCNLKISVQLKEQ